MSEYIKYLKSNKIGIIPHDTIPGIIARMSEKNAERVLAIKERSKNKGFIILVPNKQHVIKLSENILPTTEKIIDKYWPGPLTIIFKKSSSIPNIISGSNSTIAIRYPKHPLLNKILESLDEPLITTSANIANQTNISKELLSRVDFFEPSILNSKPLNQGSTIIDGTKEDSPVIRQGSLLISR